MIKSFRILYSNDQDFIINNFNQWYNMVQYLCHIVLNKLRMSSWVSFYSIEIIINQHNKNMSPYLVLYIEINVKSLWIIHKQQFFLIKN